MTTMLSIRDLEAGYGKVKVLHGISMEVPKGQGRHADRIERRGARPPRCARSRGMIRPTAGSIALKDRRIDGMESYRIARFGIAHSPEGRRVFATMTGHRQPDPRRLPAPDAGTCEGRRRRRSRARSRAVPATQGTSPSTGRHAVGRRAADARDGARGDARARGRAARRAVDGSSRPILVDEVFRIIERLKGEGVTMLLVEQFAAAALAVADYGYVLENGRISTPRRSRQAEERSSGQGRLSGRESLSRFGGCEQLLVFMRDPGTSRSVHGPWPTPSPGLRSLGGRRPSGAAARRSGRQPSWITRLRPPCLAAYRRRSASVNIAAWSSASVAAATPMLDRDPQVRGRSTAQS